MDIGKPLIRIIDDDAAMRRSWAFLIESEEWDIKTYADAMDFIVDNDVRRPGCLVLDVNMPRMSGPELQEKMQDLGIELPIIFISGQGDIDTAVHTMKHGALDFLQKPVDAQRLLVLLRNAVRISLKNYRTETELSEFRRKFENLTLREREVIRRIAQGYSNRQAAEDLGITEKTVQVHRGSVYRKLGLHNAATIARFLMRIGYPL